MTGASDSAEGSTAEPARPPVDAAADAAAGDVPAADAAMAELARMDDLPVEAHADVYELVHNRLQDAIGDADEG